MKKRKLLSTLSVLSVPAAALMLGSSQGAQIGINFQADWSPYTSYSGKPVTATALGIDPGGWFNMLPVSTGVPAKNSQVLNLPGGKSLLVSWSQANSWTSGIDADSTGTNVPPGIDEVLWGYLDDPSPGFSVTLSGLRSFCSDYTLQTIAASDGASGFANVQLQNLLGTQSINYTNDPAQFFPVGGAGWATSTVSSAFVTLNGNDSVTIKGDGRNGNMRSTLAGIVLSYTPGGANPPLIEVNPQAPTNTVFTGQSFGLSVQASGTPQLGYQWRFGGVAIPGATASTYTKSNVSVADSGNYDVVVTNAVNSVTSLVAVVTISPASQPQIVQGPLSQTRFAGYTATLNVQATGGQLSYQWKKGLTTIGSATNATLSLPNLTTNDSGTYSVTVSNPVGSTNASATLTVKVPVAGSYEDAVARSTPLVYLRLGETGSLPQDTAANTGSLGTDGTGLYLSGALHPVAGALAAGGNTAAYFNGNGAQVMVPYSASLNPAVFSAEAWLKPDLALAPADTKAALSCGDLVGNRAGWLIYQTGNGWNLRMYNLNGATPSLNITGGSTAVPGAWYHVAVTFDGTTAIVYVNGVASTNALPTSYVPGTAGPLTIGVRSDNTFFWQGAADEVAIYSTALSPARILAHYQAGTNAAPVTPYTAVVAADNPVEYVRLGEAAFPARKAENLGTLGPAEDGVYAPANKTVGGDVGMTLGAIGPRPPTFPGLESTNIGVLTTNGSVDLAALNLNTNTVTLVCWVNRDAAQSGDLAGLVFERLGSEATGLHMLPNGELRYHWNGGDYDWSSGLVLPESQWAFAALVIEPAQATIYMDDGTGLVSAVHTANHLSVPFSNPLRVGQDPQGTRYFSGKLDEVAVYGRALSVGEIGLLDLRASGRPVLVQLVPGGVIEDSKPSGTLHPGFNHGATWTASDIDSAPRTRNGVEHFSALAGAQVTVPADPDFNGTSGTIMFWMRANAPLPTLGNEGSILFDRRTTAGTVLVMADTGALFFQAAGGANAFSGGYLPDDLWHHVACVYDQTSGGTVSLYVDGVLAASNPNSSAWSWPATQQIEIGRSHDAYWRHYEGAMDDFRIYNRAFNATEVGQVFANDALVDTAALKLRFNFGTAGIGKSVVWQYGTLESSPTLGPSAVWTPVPGAVSPYGFLPTGSATFFRSRVQ